MGVILLLAAGLLLILAEVLVFPGVGLAAVLGLLAIVASGVLWLTTGSPTGIELGIALAMVASSGAATLYLGWQVARRFGSADPEGSRLIDRTSMPREAGYLPREVREELVGAEGVALTRLNPSGSARIGDEPMDVVSEAGWVEPGTPVRVVSAETYRLVVRPVEPSA